MAAWTKVESYTSKSDFGESALIEISNRTINGTKLPTLFEGEKNSVAITFIMDRYYNGLDLIDENRKIKISYISGDVEFLKPVVNVFTSDDDKIKFTWIPDQYVTYSYGKINFCIKVIGIDLEGESVVWSTENSTVNISRVVNPFIGNDPRLFNVYTLTPSNFISCSNGYTYTYTINIPELTYSDDVNILSACTTIDEAIQLSDSDLDYYVVEDGKLILYFRGYKPISNVKLKISKI